MNDAAPFNHIGLISYHHFFGGDADDSHSEGRMGEITNQGKTPLFRVFLTGQVYFLQIIVLTKIAGHEEIVLVAFRAS